MLVWRKNSEGAVAQSFESRVPALTPHCLCSMAVLAALGSVCPTLPASASLPLVCQAAASTPCRSQVSESISPATPTLLIAVFQKDEGEDEAELSAFPLRFAWLLRDFTHPQVPMSMWRSEHTLTSLDTNPCVLGILGTFSCEAMLSILSSNVYVLGSARKYLCRDGGVAQW